jgi:hypothetical protein
MPGSEELAIKNFTAKHCCLCCVIKSRKARADVIKHFSKSFFVSAEIKPSLICFQRPFLKLYFRTVLCESKNAQIHQFIKLPSVRVPHNLEWS